MSELNPEPENFFKQLQLQCANYSNEEDSWIRFGGVDGREVHVSNKNARMNRKTKYFGEINPDNFGHRLRNRNFTKVRDGSRIAGVARYELRTLSGEYFKHSSDPEVFLKDYVERKHTSAAPAKQLTSETRSTPRSRQSTPRSIRTPDYSESLTQSPTRDNDILDASFDVLADSNPDTEPCANCALTLRRLRSITLKLKRLRSEHTSQAEELALLRLAQAKQSKTHDRVRYLERLNSQYEIAVDQCLAKIQLIENSQVSPSKRRHC